MLGLQELDRGLAGWIKVRRAQKQKVTYKLITHEAALRLKKIPSASSDGARIKPLVMMPHGPKSRTFKKTNEKFGKKLHPVWQNTTLMHNDTTKLYLRRPSEALWVNVINSFKVCGIGAIGGADDHLIHCLKEGNSIPNGLYGLIKAREAAEAQELAAGFEIEAPYEDDTGHISDVELIDDEPAAFDDESTGSEEENHNLRDDSDF